MATNACDKESLEEFHDMIITSYFEAIEFMALANAKKSQGIHPRNFDAIKMAAINYVEQIHKLNMMSSKTLENWIKEINNNWPSK